MFNLKVVCAILLVLGAAFGDRIEVPGMPTNPPKVVTQGTTLNPNNSIIIDLPIQSTKSPGKPTITTKFPDNPVCSQVYESPPVQSYAMIKLIDNGNAAVSHMRCHHFKKRRPSPWDWPRPPSRPQPRPQPEPTKAPQTTSKPTLIPAISTTPKPTNPPKPTSAPAPATTATPTVIVAQPTSVASTQSPSSTPKPVVRSKFCNGAILNSRTILFSFSCLVNFHFDKVKVMVSETTLSGRSLWMNVSMDGTVCDTKDFSMPADSVYLHDFGIVRLKNEINFGHRVKPVCLAKDNLFTECFIVSHDGSSVKSQSVMMNKVACKCNPELKSKFCLENSEPLKSMMTDHQGVLVCGRPTQDGKFSWTANGILSSVCENQIQVTDVVEENDKIQSLINSCDQK